MSVNSTPRRYNRRKGSSHIAYDNMLGSDLRLQSVEDDMEQSLNDQMKKIQHALKLKGMQRKEGKLLKWLSDHTMSIKLHETSDGHHHINPCIFLPQNHISYGSI